MGRREGKEVCEGGRERGSGRREREGEGGGSGRREGTTAVECKQLQLHSASLAFTSAVYEKSSEESTKKLPENLPNS